MPLFPEEKLREGRQWWRELRAGGWTLGSRPVLTPLVVGGQVSHTAWRSLVSLSVPAMGSLPGDGNNGP